MSQVTIRQVSIGYQGPQLLDNVDCRIDAGERIGLLGRNGTGKTTLMKLLMGMEVADQGTIEFALNTRLAFLQQDVPDQGPSSVEQVISSGLDDEFNDPEKHWERDQLIARTLSQLELDGCREYSSLSVGLKRRTLLGRAIVGKPDVLLLDEPTNHLDMDSITWLEGFLASQPFTLLFVTHDRQFLRRLASRIWEIDRGRLFDWTCDYDTFLNRKELALAAEEKQQALFDKRLAQEEVWIRTGIKARRTRNEGRVRRLEQMRRIRSQRPKAVGNVRMQIDVGDLSGQLVCEMQGASFGYGEKKVISSLDLTVLRGDKIGILGRNGAGKSTLLKGMLGQMAPMSGTVRHGTRLEIGYFDQTRQVLDPTKTAEENVGEGKTTIEVNGQSRHIIGYLQDFLFTPDQARTPIQFFSGGQRNRLLLAKLFSKSANMLVLDEPTNDLDLETLELLEERLVDYEGTLIVVSHDRAFLNNCVTSLLVFEDDRIKEYVGGYDDWLRQTAGSRAISNSANIQVKPTASRPTPEQSPKKLTYKQRLELDGLPKKIESLELELSQLHAKMSDAAYYKSAPAIQVADRARETELEELLSASYIRWEELEEA